MSFLVLMCRRKLRQKINDFREMVTAAVGVMQQLSVNDGDGRGLRKVKSRAPHGPEFLSFRASGALSRAAHLDLRKIWDLYRTNIEPDLINFAPV